MVIVIHVVLYLCSKCVNRDVHFHCRCSSLKIPVVCKVGHNTLLTSVRVGREHMGTPFPFFLYNEKLKLAMYNLYINCHLMLVVGSNLHLWPELF